MSMFYSPETGGFYHPTIHPVIPADAVALTGERHAELVDGLAAGQVIEVKAGEAILAAPPAPTQEQLLARLRRQRDQLLSDSDYLMMADYPMDAAWRAAWADYRQQLRDLPETITDPAEILWPEPPTGESN